MSGDDISSTLRERREPPPPPSAVKIAEDNVSGLSVPCVFLKCPFGCSAVYSKAVMDDHLLVHLKRMILYRQLEASVLMINSLGRNKDRLILGLQILCKYLDNVINNPEEDKYRNISEHNRAFQEKVSCIEGARDFLHAVGFLPRTVTSQDKELPFLVMSEECAANTESIKTARDLLLNSQPVPADLHRDVRVYYPSSKEDEFLFPRDFYDIIPGSRGLAARFQRSIRQYNYTVIRIRFPDGVLLQGTFQADEKLSVLRSFISSSLERQWQPFILQNKQGDVISDVDSSLAQLKLVPGAVLSFGFTPTIEAEMATGLYFCIHGPVQQEHHLKSDLMRLIKIL